MDLSNINANNKSMAALLDAMKKTKFAKSDYGNENEWAIHKDNDGNGSALIRFIPSPDGELFVQIRNHGYQNKKTGKWFIENCPKTLDWENGCPTCEHANELKDGRKWEQIPEKEQTKIKPFFAKTSYWANILVEKDPANPENEGKVFKFRFGAKILEKIGQRALDDEFDETKKGINVFDLKDGASFKLIVKRVKGWSNYDSSDFNPPSKVKNGDELVKSGHEIGQMRTSENFKEYDELKRKFYAVLNGGNIPSSSAEDMVSKEESVPDDLNDVLDTQEPGGSGADDDEDIKYFNEIMNSDDEDVPF